MAFQSFICAAGSRVALVHHAFAGGLVFYAQ